MNRFAWVAPVLLAVVGLLISPWTAAAAEQELPTRSLTAEQIAEDTRVLRECLTAEAVEAFFKPLGCGAVKRYELPNLIALNFVLPEVLAGGGSRSLRVDAQGKTLGQAALEMSLDVPEHLLPQCRPPGRGAG